jgi:two-component system sensor histidine kinase BaeS
VNRRRSLRTNLFVATVLVVVLSVGLMLVVGAILTRRQVEHATLEGLSHQADVLTAREVVAIVPLGHLKALNKVLRKQQEHAYAVTLRHPSPYLPGDLLRRVSRGQDVDTTARVNHVDYFLAARKVTNGPGAQALVLLRPRSRGNSAFYPFLVGLLIAAGAGISLAALAAYLLARRIARPVRRVVDASHHLAEERDPGPVPIEGAYEIASLARAFNEMAEQLARARAAEKQFLLSVSHELKTPLTAIRGYAEGVEDGAFDIDEAVATISAEAARLERLVGDLLDLARMNRTDFSIHREALDLGETASEAVRRYESQAREFGVTLEGFAPAPAPAVGDRDRVLQVLSNYLNNAVKFTPAGGHVGLRLTPSPDGGVRFAVSDTGPGISSDEMSRLFVRFWQSKRTAHLGSGLGLAIAKGIAEAHRGRVWAESAPGAGSTFYLALPRASECD